MTDATPWYENDELWEECAPFLFNEERLANTETEVEQVLVLLGANPGAEILDLCCGPGRHSLELARRGLRVTGVDRTQAYLDRARRQAETEQLNIEFVRDDMKRFCRPEAFDGAINLYTSFGYYENPADNQQVLLNVYRSLREHGRFVMELTGKEVLAAIFRERDWREADGTILLEHRKISRDWNFIQNRWIVFKGNHRKEFRISHWLYSAGEITSLLTGSGFISVDVYGDFFGNPYDHTAEKMVVLAHKGQG